MNYSKIYFCLIEKRKISPINNGYLESHHIIPRSLGGSNDSSNIVALTAREHFVAHWLLAKIHGGPMWAAFCFMCSGNCNSGRGVKITGKIYENAKKKMSEHYKITNKGSRNPNWKNDKVKGAANGRHRKEVYVWQNKETGLIIEATCYEAYSNHGMSKPGVIDSINGKRKGTKAWLLLGVKGEVDVSQLPKGRAKCRKCKLEKWVGAFKMQRSKRDSLCRACNSAA